MFLQLKERNQEGDYELTHAGTIPLMFYFIGFFFSYLFSVHNQFIHLECFHASRSKISNRHVIPILLTRSRTDISYKYLYQIPLYVSISVPHRGVYTNAS